MKNRLSDLRNHCLKDGLNRFDRSVSLTGDSNPGVYTPEILKKRFIKERFTGRSLHPYRDSLSFALLLLLIGSRRDFSGIPKENRRDPILSGGGSMKATADGILKAFLDYAPDPDGRLKWFLEEPKCCDGNGTFFSTAPLLLIEHCFGGELPKKRLNAVRSVLKNAYRVFAEETKTCSWSYVNPALAAYAFSALLSEKFEPDQFARHSEELLNYMKFLEEKGIAENYTTTYLLVDTVIILCVLLVTGSRKIKTAAKHFLNGVLLREAAFFGKRFPSPYRRGYNGSYVTERYDFVPYLFGWSDRIPENDRDPFLTMFSVAAFSLYAEKTRISRGPDEVFPRELTLPIHNDCRGFSYLDRKFLIGAFDKYPSTDNIVWQCVTSGGSGWQDGPVYATFENKAETSLSLRLEAVDADGTFRCHPFEGEFTMEKVKMIYPWRSFPPEPKIRTVLKRNHLLCLTKIDKVDAVLQKLGFNLHFARFDGELLDLDGKPVSGETAGPVIVRMEGIHVGIFPLKRVLMKGSNLWTFAGCRNDFQVDRKKGELNLRMYNLDEKKPELYTQNHIFGGFYLMIEPECSTEEFIRKMKAVKISDVSEKNRINAAIDLRDAIRTVCVSGAGEPLQLTWDHYRNE